MPRSTKRDRLESESVRVDYYDVGALIVLTVVGFASYGIPGAMVASGLVLTFFAATHVLIVRPVNAVEELEDELLKEPIEEDEEVDE